MPKYTLDELRAGLAAEERDAERFGLPEGVARGRRWLDLPDHEAITFAGLATELADNLDGEGSVDLWARVAGFWHLAGDSDQARRWSKRVARERRQFVAPATRAGAWYLLGDHRKALGTGDDGAAARLAEVARSGDGSLLPDIRHRLARLAMHSTDGPHQASSGTPLTVWDWLEESFLLESRLTGEPVPSHEEMLRRCGVWSDEPASTAEPVPLSPPVDLRADLASGAWLDVIEPGQVKLVIPPSLSVVLRHEFDRWGAWIPDAPQSSGEWIVEPEFVDWRHAGAEAAEWIGVNGRPREAAAGQEADLRALLSEAGGEAGSPVATPRPVPEPEDDALPTMSSEYSGIVELTLTDDLFAELRSYEEGWGARVAPDNLTHMEVAVPPSAATWQDAAQALGTWLTEHRGGHGVPELRQLMEP